MVNSRIIIGLVMIILGIALTIVSFLKIIFLLIYGLPLIGIGIAILLNKKEDVIEQIKFRRKNGN